MGSGRDRGELHLGIAGPAIIIDAIIALEALGPIEHAVEHPRVGMIVYAALTPRHAHDRIDGEIVLRVDVKEQVLVSFRRRPTRRVRPQSLVRHQLLKQRLGFFHPALVVGISCPDRAQVVDEFVENWQSCVRHCASCKHAMSPKFGSNPFGWFMITPRYTISY